MADPSEQDLSAMGHAFYQAFAENKPEIFDTLLAEDYQAVPAVPGNPGGRDGQKGTVGSLHSVFDGLRYQADEVHVSGNTICCRATLSGTHVGEFLGIPPTGRQVQMATMEFHTVTDGLISKTVHIEDFFGAAQQLTV